MSHDKSRPSFRVGDRVVLSKVLLTSSASQKKLKGTTGTIKRINISRTGTQEFVVKFPTERWSQHLSVTQIKHVQEFYS